MTREEASQRIKEWLANGRSENGYLEYTEGWFSEDDEKAFDMAIEALLQPPSDDWEKYSGRLWKEAYERGKLEALEDAKVNAQKEVREAYERGKAEAQWNNHTVACLLADLFNDTCACNYNGIDEWLPKYCELHDACLKPFGVACWEQFLKHRKMRGET